MPYAKPSGASITHKKGPSGLIKAYLVAYNLASTAGWSYVLYLLVQHLASTPKAPATAAEQAIETAQTLVARLLALIRQVLPFLLPPPSTREQVREALPTELHGVWARATTAYQDMGDVTALVQSGAVLEVIHVLLGFVKSPLITTSMQVASRLFMVWGVMERFPEVHSNPVYATMVLAWSVTEVIRYPFYALSLLGIDFAPLVWLRYTTFYLLYPLGAISEATLLYASLPTDPVREGIQGYSTFDWVRLAFFGIWWPSLYVMYTYMMKQRRKVVGSAKSVKTVKTE